MIAAVMKIRVVFASLFFATATSLLAANTNSVVRTITLRSCIERALMDNLEIRFERINPSIASWGVTLEAGAFDPNFTAGAIYNDSSTPSATAGPTEKRQLTPTLGLDGTLTSGTGYNLGVTDSRTGGTGYNDYLYTGNASLTLTQPLLKNFGFDANTAQYRVARKKRDIAIQNFQMLVMNKIGDVSKAYYELVYAIENHKALVEDLGRAKQLLDENRRRVQIGVMSPLDVTQAEAGVAEREEVVIVAERTIKDNENTLKRLITGEMQRFQGESLAPVDYPIVEMIETDVTRSTRAALESRPDFNAAKQEVERQNILVKWKQNQLWPELDLQGSYGMNGLAYSGFHTLTAREFSNDNPAWSVGLSISFPLGNRKARSHYNIARLDREQALITLKQLEQNIVLAVDNAVGRLQTNLKRVDATRAASRLAAESLKAEETKLRAGASTSFLVLQAQSQLAAAKAAEIRARADYSESLITLDLAEGNTLRKNNITLDDRF